ncbi:sigma-70 family RNA polymerase sigma factor [Winogradskyella psychrotolerans]|uniref:RNA polymerase sigma factor n=1 Tax=Winogradskyella psychrotolerans TaxID=1344585 RepID=UPI001C074813|nr:sigma-70 family RNA polymerase sigma factor [Winogradskyella psychrotolerans]MBU2922514.1 sigma-70 family RNA polymerase sigma factor [Winogradskyella psychrotolerans]
MKNTLSDNDLQRQLRADDKKALESVYLSYKQAFLNYAKRYDIATSDVLDIYQDAIIAMHQNFVTSQLELQNSTIKTYLFGIGKNKIFKTLKAQQRVIRVDVENDNYTEIKIEEELPTANQHALAKRLSELSETCKTVLQLFYYRNLTIEEIVGLTHYKDANTVRSHKSRCLKHLKTLFKVN